MVNFTSKTACKTRTQPFIHSTYISKYSKFQYIRTARCKEKGFRSEHRTSNKFRLFVLYMMVEETERVGVSSLVSRILDDVEIDLRVFVALSNCFSRPRGEPLTSLKGIS